MAGSHFLALSEAGLAGTRRAVVRQRSAASHLFGSGGCALTVCPAAVSGQAGVHASVRPLDWDSIAAVRDGSRIHARTSLDVGAVCALKSVEGSSGFVSLAMPKFSNLHDAGRAEA
jgi:hypothetical protein